MPLLHDVAEPRGGRVDSVRPQRKDTQTGIGRAALVLNQPRRQEHPQVRLMAAGDRPNGRANSPAGR